MISKNRLVEAVYKVGPLRGPTSIDLVSQDITVDQAA